MKVNFTAIKLFPIAAAAASFVQKTRGQSNQQRLFTSTDTFYLTIRFLAS